MFSASSAAGPSEEGSALQFFTAAPFPRLHVLLPLVGSRVAAGFPSPASDHLEDSFDLNELLVKNPPATFLVRGVGRSMEGMHIYDGDFLLVDQAVEPRDGHVVIACLDGEFTCKLLRRENGVVWLQAANPEFRAIEITPERDFEVWGVVTSKITRFKV